MAKHLCIWLCRGKNARTIFVEMELVSQARPYQRERVWFHALEQLVLCEAITFMMFTDANSAHFFLKLVGSIINTSFDCVNASTAFFCSDLNCLKPSLQTESNNICSSFVSAIFLKRQ